MFGNEDPKHGQRPIDTMMELLKGTQTRGKIVREDMMETESERDALLFSRIKPQDISLSKSIKRNEKKKCEADELLSALLCDERIDKTPEGMIETPKSPPEGQCMKRTNENKRNREATTEERDEIKNRIEAVQRSNENRRARRETREKTKTDREFEMKIEFNKEFNMAMEFEARQKTKEQEELRESTGDYNREREFYKQKLYRKYSGDQCVDEKQRNIDERHQREGRYEQHNKRDVNGEQFKREMSYEQYQRDFNPDYKREFNKDYTRPFNVNYKKEMPHEQYNKKQNSPIIYNMSQGSPIQYNKDPGYINQKQEPYPNYNIEHYFNYTTNTMPKYGGYKPNYSQFNREPLRRERFQQNARIPIDQARRFPIAPLPFPIASPSVFLHHRPPFCAGYPPRPGFPMRIPDPPRKSDLHIRMKMFPLSPMTSDQKKRINKLLMAEDGIRFTFFRTLGEVSQILGLPQLSYGDANELRILYNLFSRYRGYTNTSSGFLNSIKKKISRYHFKYLSYVVPLEVSGYYYKPGTREKTSFSPTREELNTVLCVGIYDDLFCFMELLEKGEVPGCLIAELLNLFFLTSNILFRKFEKPLPLEKLTQRLGSKPYKIVLERMSREVLYQLQEAVFRVILRFEEGKRVEQALNEETLACMLEAILHRRCIKSFPDIMALEAEGCGHEEVLALKLINAMHTNFKATDKIVQLAIDVGEIDPSLLLHACGKIQFDEETLQEIYARHSGFIRAQARKHLQTVANRILLDDNRELEVILTRFGHLVFGDGDSRLRRGQVLEIVKGYRDHLISKRVYFYKRKSSNIGNIIDCLCK